MASFTATLHVAGHRYPVRQSHYEFSQATDQRGRATAKVRAGLIYLTLDVPTEDVLRDWAATPYKPLGGHITYFDAHGGATLETLSWEQGHCVGYREEFVAGDAQSGAYLCHLTISAPRLNWQPGALASSELALLQPPPLLVPPAPPPLVPPVAPVVEEVTAAAGATLLAPALLTLGLILGTATPTSAIDTLPKLPMVTEDEARLLYLEGQRALRTLTPSEEREFIDLLAKVRGIYVQNLSDIALVAKDFVGKVPMSATDLGRMALNYRCQHDLWHPGNVAVFEYEDAEGNLQHLVQSTQPPSGKHAERIAYEKLKAEGIPFENVKRIYSELEPCEIRNGGLRGEGCKQMIKNFFPNAKVTYSYDYPGTFTDTQPIRQASLEQRNADFLIYKHLCQ